MNYFRDLVLNEERDFSEYGFSVEGEALSISVKKAKFNSLMEIEFSGKNTLTGLKSAEYVKDEYQKEDWDRIGNIYKGLTEKYSADIEKLVNTFEKDLNKVIVKFEKEVGKLL